MPKKTTEAGKTTHRWTPAERGYLIDHAGDSGKELVAGFRSIFPDFDGSDVAIVGRRHVLLNRSRTPEGRVAGLEAKLAAAIAKVEAIQADLDAAKAETTGPDYEAMTKGQLLDAAEDRGVEVRKSWSKAQLVEALS